MKVAISHPSTFSRVRRGTERFVHELGRYLAARGHEVRVITNTAGARELIPIDGYVEDRRRRLWHPLLGKAGIDASRAFLLTSLAEFARPRYDVIQACSNLDAFAAATLRRLTGVPCAYFVNALPPPVRYYQGLSGGGALFRRAVRGCSEVVALSRFIQTNLERLCGRGGIVLPVPVDTEVFRLASGARPRHPVILCAAALDDGRKGGATLMRAFDRLKARRPTARLVVSSTIPDAVREQLLGLVSPANRDDVAFLDSGRPEDVPALYANATVSVLPSRWEAFGLVVAESLAVGTPVVGTRDGAIPELIDSDDVGRLFDLGDPSSPAPTNVEGLADALDAAIDLAADPATAARCNERAQAFSWYHNGPRYESLYERLIDERRSAR